MRKALFAAAAALTLVGTSAPLAHAALTANSTLTQSIGNGTISTDVRDVSNVVVGSPSFAMSAATVSTSMQTSTGTFGSNTQRISVDNPGGANSGFSLTLNAAVPGTGTWTSGGNTYPYNGATAALGQLTVNPVAGSWTARVGTTTAITEGSQATFSGSTAITLATAAAGLEDIWNGYMVDTGLSQTIPANTPAGSYSISMVQTVAAL